MKTIIKVFKVSELGRKHFFKVEMEGHHTDSISVQEVAKSLFLNYKLPFFEVTVTLVETKATVVNVEDL